MDVEIEEVAKLLFPDENSDLWKDSDEFSKYIVHLSSCGVEKLDLWKDSDEFSKYIVHLSSCGVEKLGKEGAHLREERLAILDQTRDLAYSNYKTFIHTADCSRTIFKDFTSVETHLEGLSCCLPDLRASVEQFLATSRSLSHSRHLTSLTLVKHTQLLEVLELPQLMDTCVRNGYYDEALEILAYVRRLERKHTDIHIIAGIVTEVQSGTRLMLNQLLAQLRSPLALPQCLKVIGLLRRLDVFTEPELRLKFLQARDAWFTGILKSIPKDDPYQHIIKVVEASRVHLFDIVTQYRAIFSDDDTRFSLGDPEVNEQAIFHGWILHKVNHFIKLVDKDLKRGVGSNLESVLAQCMFFGQSFSRIGADFRNLLIPLFQKAALVQCEKDVRVANIRFDETLSSFSLMEAPQLSASSTYVTETQDRTRPPLTLMEFPPLAHYMNGLVAAFNTLRHCCPVSSLPEVMHLLHQSLTKVIGALLELHRLESSGFTAKEEASFQRLCLVIAEGVLPHVNACLRLLYPLQQISFITGEHVAKLQRENFGQLDLDELLAPISGLLPKKEDNFLATSEELQQDMAYIKIHDIQETSVSSEDVLLGIQNAPNTEEPKQDVSVAALLSEETPLKENEGLLGKEASLQENEGLASEEVTLPENEGLFCEETSLLENELLLEEETSLPEKTSDMLADTGSLVGNQILHELHRPLQEDQMIGGEQTLKLDGTAIGLDERATQDEIIHEIQNPSLTIAAQASIPQFQLALESEQAEMPLSEQDSNKMSDIPL